MDRTPTATSVYRYYDELNALIYVGITSRGIRRNVEHNTSKAWWKYVVRQEVDHFPTREKALSTERDLIRTYRPPFNVQHNPDHARARAQYVALREAGVQVNVQQMLAARKRRLQLAVVGHSQTPGGRHVVQLRSHLHDAPFATLFDLPEDMVKNAHHVQVSNLGVRGRAVIWRDGGFINAVARGSLPPPLGYADMHFKYRSQKPIALSATHIQMHPGDA